MVYKYFLIGLFLLLSIALISTKPGIGELEKYYLYINNPEIYTTDLADIFIKYPPGIHLIAQSLPRLFPLNNSIQLFRNQDIFIAFKLTLFSFYIFTFLVLLYLAKTNKRLIKMSLIDISVAYFLSVSLLILNLGLGYFETYAAPFFILTITFLLSRRINLAAIFYLVSLSLSWNLLIFAPLFIFLTRRQGNRRFGFNSILPILSFLLIPLFLILYFAPHFVSSSNLLQIQSSSRLFNFPLLIKQLLYYFSAPPQMNLLALVVLLFGGIFVMVTLFTRLKQLNNLPPISVILIAMCMYLSFILFIPGISEGSLIFLVLMSLIFYTLSGSPLSRLQLLIINVLVFFNLFVFFGPAGRVPVRGDYFIHFSIIFALLFILFSIWFITSFYKIHFNFDRAQMVARNNLLIWLKKFLIVYMILVNLSLIPADGSSDVVSFNDTALLSIQYGNPFKVKAIDLQMYPPLYTVIIDFFAHMWRIIVGTTQDYRIAIKLSVLSFYFLTVWVYLKLTKNSNKEFTNVNKLVVILATFALIIQTQGFSDVNIYAMPFFFIAVVSLFKQKHFLSGLMFAVAFSIKIQPIMLLPLFLATLLGSNEAPSLKVKNLLLFLGGFASVLVIIWYFVLIEPGGFASLARTYDYLFNTSGFHYLSGQAMNLDWVATYFLHIFQPERYYSLQYLDFLNRQISKIDAPFIFRGYLFYLAAFIILLRFWFTKKKDIITFLEVSVMIFFSHHILNASAHEKHLFYVLAFMLFLFLFRPSESNRKLLILFDVMTSINLIFFYGFTGPKDINRLLFELDMTVLFSVFFVVIYVWVLKRYLTNSLFNRKAL